MTRLEVVLRNLLREGKLSFAEVTVVLASVKMLDREIHAVACVHPVVTEYGTQILEGLQCLNEDT